MPVKHFEQLTPEQKKKGSLLSEKNLFRKKIAILLQLSLLHIKVKKNIDLTSKFLVNPLSPRFIELCKLPYLFIIFYQVDIEVGPTFVVDIQKTSKRQKVTRMVSNTLYATIRFVSNFNKATVF